MRYSQELKEWDLFNSAFSTSRLGIDGKALIATDHPSYGQPGVTHSNLVTGSLSRFAAGLFGPVTLGAAATLDLTPNSAGVSPNKAGYLGGGVLGSHKSLDLVSFFSAEVFVHWATSTWRLKRP
jgi:hypothetical protein